MDKCIIIGAPLRVWASSYRTVFTPLLALCLLATLLIYCEVLIIRTPLTRTSHESTRKYPRVSNGFYQHLLKINRTQLSNAEILHDIQEDSPNFPLQFWIENKNEPLYYKNKSCAPFPNVFTLKTNNLYWQILNTANGVTFYLYGAYYDIRINPSIRLLAMVDQHKPNDIKTYCQAWFAESKEPVFIAAKYKSAWMFHCNDGFYCPYLITCPIPSSFHRRVPIFVSLVENTCDAAYNCLRVIYNKPTKDPKGEKNRFAVCVKHFDYVLQYDPSIRIIEWIELVKLLGAQKIFFYSVQIHENSMKVLKYYERRGEAVVTPMTYPGNQPTIGGSQRIHFKNDYGTWQQMINEVISLNDCFFKNIYLYDYIALLDTDEVIMPLKQDNWMDLLKSISNNTSSKNSRTTHYTARDVLFIDHESNTTKLFPDIPPYMYMLQHVRRQTNHSTHIGPKTFFDTKLVEIVHNHWPVSCLNGSCSEFRMNTNEAQKQHYRDKPRGNDKWSNMTFVIDRNIWRYKELLIECSLAAINDLGFYNYK